MKSYIEYFTYRYFLEEVLLMKYDLHAHTSYSDGLLSPAELIDLAVKQGLQGIAITDHDTIEGIDEGIRYSRRYDNFKVIPSIEFGTVYEDEEVHILGHFIDFKNEELINITKKLRLERVNRGIKMINKLNELNMDITIDDVKRHSGDNYIGRPHIARALIDKKFVTSIEEAFEKYLNRGMPGYVERFHLSIEDTINLIKRTKGIATLAHPGLLKNKSIVDYTISKGIQGLECIYSKHSVEDTEYFIELARKKNLIITGGSDYHGDLVGGELILGKFYIDINEIPVMRGKINNV